MANVGLISAKADIGSRRDIKIQCGVEQLVARWAHNPKVIGSSPVPATKKAWSIRPGFSIYYVYSIYIVFGSV